MSFGQSGSKTNPLRMDGKKAKREVFKTDEIPHLWAHQTQAQARNAQGNLYFRGPTIYSYRDSWPLARIYAKARSYPKGAPMPDPAALPSGCALVLTNSERYSVTTAQQQSEVNRAASHLLCVAVPNVELMIGGYPRKDGHAQNLQHFTDAAAGLLAQAQRAMQSSNVTWREERARMLLENAARYMEFFGIRRKAPVFPADVWAAALERAQRIESPDPVRDAAKYKAREKRKATTLARLQSGFDAYCTKVAEYNAAHATPDAAEYWRENGSWPTVAQDFPRADYKQQRAWRRAGLKVPFTKNVHGACLLRVHNEDIVTSLGARIPLAAAPMVWNLVQRARASGGFAPTPALGRLKIGDYGLDRIDADGTLHAGCHTIGFGEIELLARKLGLAS